MLGEKRNQFCLQFQSSICLERDSTIQVCGNEKVVVDKYWILQEEFKSKSCNTSRSLFACLLVCLFVCLFGVFRPTREWGRQQATNFDLFSALTPIVARTNPLMVISEDP